MPVGFVAEYRQIAPWRQVVYAICTLGVFGLVIWDFFDQSAQYSTLLVIAYAQSSGVLLGWRSRSQCVRVAYAATVAADAQPAARRPRSRILVGRGPGW